MREGCMRDRVAAGFVMAIFVETFSKVNLMTSSKFSPPSSKRWLIRQRLFDRLDSFSEATSVWIAGQAGFGKTVLTASYLHSKNRPVLWLRLDRRDCEPSTFFYNLRDAAIQLGVADERALPLLTTEYVGGEQIYARNFIESLFAQTPKGLAVVLDDFHEIGESCLTARLLPDLLHSVPLGHSVYVLSRNAPHSQASRLIANQQMSVLMESELRLTLDETSALLECLPVHDIDFGTLYEQTRGWPAAVVLMSKKQSSSIPSTDTLPGGRNALFDYLVTELLDGMEQERRRFLLAMSIIPEFDPGLVGEMFGDLNYQSILDDLVSSNLFIYQEGSVYRYHPLLRQLLCHLIEKEWSVSELANTRKYVAQLLIRRNEIENALDLLASANAWDLYLDTVVSHAKNLVIQGRYQDLANYLLVTPESARSERPWYTYWLGMASLPTDSSLSYRYFCQAFEQFLETEDLEGIVKSWCGAVDSIVYSLSNAARLDEWLERYYFLERQSVIVDAEVQSEFDSRLIVIFLFRQPDNPRLKDKWHKTKDQLQLHSDANQRMIGGLYLISYSLWSGQINESSKLLERLAPSKVEDLSPLATTAYCLLKAWLGWISGDKEGCRAAINKGVDVAESTGVFVWHPILLMQGVTDALVNGDYKKAELHFSQIDEHRVKRRDLDCAYYYMKKAWVKLFQGRTLDALEFQRQSISAAESCGVIYTLAEAYFVMTQIQINAGDYTRAWEYLEKFDACRKRFDSWTLYVQYRIASAQILIAQGDFQGASQVLSSVMDKIRQKGIVVFKGWNRESISELMAFCIQNKIAIDVAQKIIKDFSLPTPTANVTRDWPWPVKITTLGGFTIETANGKVDLTGNKHRRPCDVLKVLICRGGAGMAEQLLADTLWPDLEGDAAIRNLRTNIHRLRKMLGQDKSVVLEDGVVKLNRRICWIDCDELMLRLSTLKCKNPTNSRSVLRELLDGFCEPFLPGDEAYYISEVRATVRARLFEGLGALKSDLDISLDRLLIGEIESLVAHNGLGGTKVHHERFDGAAIV